MMNTPLGRIIDRLNTTAKLRRQNSEIAATEIYDQLEEVYDQLETLWMIYDQATHPLLQGIADLLFTTMTWITPKQRELAEVIDSNPSATVQPFYHIPALDEQAVELRDAHEYFQRQTTQPALYKRGDYLLDQSKKKQNENAIGKVVEPFLMTPRGASSVDPKVWSYYVVTLAGLERFIEEKDARLLDKNNVAAALEQMGLNPDDWRL